jgi:hypothetical protein
MMSVKRYGASAHRLVRRLHNCHHPRKRMIQYSEEVVIDREAAA